MLESETSYHICHICREVRSKQFLHLSVETGRDQYDNKRLQNRQI